MTDSIPALRRSAAALAVLISTAIWAPGIMAQNNATQSPSPATGGTEGQITGILSKIDGPKLTIRTRLGRTVLVDDTDAAKAYQMFLPLRLGLPLMIKGTYDSAGTLHAVAILLAKDSPLSWPQDY